MGTLQSNYFIKVLEIIELKVILKRNSDFRALFLCFLPPAQIKFCQPNEDASTQLLIFITEEEYQKTLTLVCCYGAGVCRILPILFSDSGRLEHNNTLATIFISVGDCEPIIIIESRYTSTTYAVSGLLAKMLPRSMICRARYYR